VVNEFCIHLRTSNCSSITFWKKIFFLDELLCTSWVLPCDRNILHLSPLSKLKSSTSEFPQSPSSDVVRVRNRAGTSVFTRGKTTPHLCPTIEELSLTHSLSPGSGEGEGEPARWDMDQHPYFWLHVSQRRMLLI
jgi:hypothetical protein